MKRTGLLGVALVAAGCQLGPGVPCTDDVACSPWGRCGAQGFCLALEDHGGASLVPELTDAGARAVVMSETSLDFGEVPCDAHAPARTFSLRNDSSQTLTLSSSLRRKPSAFQVNLAGMIAPGSTVQVKVTPVRVPKTADTSPDFFGDTLTLRAMGAALDETHELALHLTARGARLTLAPIALTFSAAAPAVDTQVFVIENAGNEPASVSLESSSRFTLPSSSVTLGAGQQHTRSVIFTPSQSPGVANGTVKLSTNATLCAPLPRDLVLVGTSR